MSKPLTQQQRLARDMSEAELQDCIIALAETLHWTAFHIRDSRRQRVTGLPDLELLRTPKAERWELKTELGKISPVQERVIALLRSCGMVVRVVRPSDWLEGNVEGWLK